MNQQSLFETLARFRDTETFRTVAETAAQLFGAPFAFVSVAYGEHEAFLGCYAPDVEIPPAIEPPLAPSWNSERASPVVVPDTRLDERLAHHPFVAGAPYLQSYVAVPIVQDQGARLVLAIADHFAHRPRVETVSALERLGSVVASLLALQQRTNDVLRAEISMFRSGLDRLPYGAAILRLDPGERRPRFLYINEAMAATTGYTTADFLTGNDAIFRDPVNRALLLRVTDAMLSGTEFRFEAKYTDADRREHFVRTLCIPLPSGSDADIGTTYLVLSRDVTERYERTEQLAQLAAREARHAGELERRREEIELLSAAVEQSREGIAILHVPNYDIEKRRVVYVNRRLCEMLEAERTLLLEGGLAQFVATSDVPLLRRIQRELLRGNSTYNAIHIVSSKGRPMIAEVRGQPLRDAGGAIAYWVLTFYDVSDARQREATLNLLETALAEASDLIAVTDATPPSQGGPLLRFANPALLGFLKLGERLEGTPPFTRFFSPAADARTVATVIERLERRLPIAHEVLMRDATGRDRWASWTARILRDDEGAVTGWFIIGRDISLRKEQYHESSVLLSALDLADDPIAVYRLYRDGESYRFEYVHANNAASESGLHPLEILMDDAEHRRQATAVRRRLDRVVPARALVAATASDGRRQWVLLHLRPLLVESGLPDSIVVHWDAIGADDVPTMRALVLAEQIAAFEQPAERRAALETVVAYEFGLRLRFGRAVQSRPPEIQLDLRKKRIRAIVPAGLLATRPSVIAGRWEGEPPQSTVTALRVFFEALLLRTEGA